MNSEPGSVTQATGQAGGPRGLSARSRSLVLGAGRFDRGGVIGIALTSHPRGPGAGPPDPRPRERQHVRRGQSQPEENSAPPAGTGAKAAGDSEVHAGRGRTQAANPATPERDKAEMARDSAARTNRRVRRQLSISGVCGLALLVSSEAGALPPDRCQADRDCRQLTELVSRWPAKDSMKSAGDVPARVRAECPSHGSSST